MEVLQKPIEFISTNILTDRSHQEEFSEDYMQEYAKLDLEIYTLSVRVDREQQHHN